jgi:ribosomal protein L2
VFLAKIYDFSNIKGEKGYYYILAPKGLKVFDRIQTIKEKKKNLNLRTGDCTLLSNFEIGDFIHNVSNFLTGFPVYARSAGSFCQILDKVSDNYIKVLLPSGSQRLISVNATATYGVLGNESFNKRIIGKAGRSR